MSPKRIVVARHLLLNPEEIASASPLDEEALWNYVSTRGWKSLYRHDRGAYRALEAAAKELDDGVDPRLKAARARGRAVLPKLRAAEGGSISVREAAKRLGITEAAVLKQYRSGTILGFIEGDVVRFPVWQLKGNGLLPGVSEILALMNHQRYELDDTLRMLVFLYDYDYLGGKSALQTLRVGKLDEALRAIRGYLEL